MSKWTQKQFNEDHLEPREYGEGDYYVVAESYSDAEAAKIIGDWETALTGEPHTYSADDIMDMKIFVSKNNDYGVYDWCVSNFDDKTPVAWGKGIAL